MIQPFSQSLEQTFWNQTRIASYMMLEYFNKNGGIEYLKYNSTTKQYISVLIGQNQKDLTTGVNIASTVYT